MNEIVALAIHDLDRDGSTYTVRSSDKLLPVSATAERVITLLYDLYNRRTSKSHGRFTTSEGSPTQEQVRRYIESDEKDFVDLTTRMMDNLAREAGKKPASDGGHVFFAHFKRDGSDYLLVTIITDKLSAALTRSNDMKDVETLDLEGFRFAGRINMTGWAEGEDRYLSFLKGKGNVSDYFREFLGCDAVVQERKDTQDLVAALKGFVAAEKMPEADGTAFLRDALEILKRTSKTKEPLEFAAFANELRPKGPETLTAYLADTDRQLNDGFVPVASALKALVRLTGKTSLWTVEFDRDAIGKNKVRFDKETNALILFDVPPQLVTQMRDEGMIDD